MSNAENTNTQTRLWSSISWRAPFTDDHHWLYSFESLLRFVDKNDKFDIAALEPGLGKEIFPGLRLWFGIRFQEQSGPHDSLQTLLIPWEALMWDIYSSAQMKVNNRFRVEERKNFSYSDIAVRIREKLQFEIPIRGSEQYYCNLFDEIIFNVTPPEWESNKLINQNRLYAGFRYRYDKNTALSLGYIFLYQFADHNEVSNVISLRLECDG